MARRNKLKEGNTKSRDEPKDEDITTQSVKEAHEIIKRLQRKYMHKTDETFTNEPETLIEESKEDMPSPSKKRDEQEGDDHLLDETLTEKENQTCIIKKQSRRNRYNVKRTPQKSTKDILLDAPNDRSTPIEYKKRQSFGFSKLNSLDSSLQSSLDPSAAGDISEFDFSSQSPAPPLHQLPSSSSNNKGRAVKTLTFKSKVVPQTKTKKYPSKKDDQVFIMVMLLYQMTIASICHDFMRCDN
jgi:hypothetical protein